MKLTSSDQADIAPGDLVRWHVEPVGRAESLSTPLSENETFHLASNHSGTPGWIALTLDYARPVARAAVDRVMRTLIERHENGVEVKGTADTLRPIVQAGLVRPRAGWAPSPSTAASPESGIRRRE